MLIFHISIEFVVWALILFSGFQVFQEKICCLIILGGGLGLRALEIRSYMRQILILAYRHRRAGSGPIVLF